MAEPPAPRYNGDMAGGSSDIPTWFGDLTEVTAALGAPAFGDRLMTFLNRMVPVDHCAVFTFAPDGGAQHLFTESKMPPSEAETLARDYVGGYFEQDPHYPVVEAARRGAAQPQRMIPLNRPSRYDQGYRSHFFEAHDLVDKASTVARAREGVVYCNFYRMGGSGSFSREDWARLDAMLPLVTSLITAHFRLCAAARPAGRGADASPRETAQSLVHSVIARDVAPFDRLTARERDVCARILLGFSSEAIALDLKIAPSSVATYRKRAYAKLAIATQHELFSLCLATIDRLNAVDA